MAKNRTDVDTDDTFDFEEFDGFDNFSPEASSKSQNSRSPIQTSYIGIGAEFTKGAASEVVSRNTLKKVVEKALPSEYGEVLGQADKAARIVKTLQDDAVKTLKPHGQGIVRRLDRLVTKEDTATRRLVEAAKRKLGVREDRYETTEEDIQNETIANELNAIFKTQEIVEGVRAAKAETNNRRRESIQNQQFKQSFRVSSEMADDVSSLRRYNDEIGQHWQRKMLELSYRQTFLQSRQVRMLEEGNQAILKQLESIVHNTALPEFSKITLSESWRENSRNRLIEVGNRAMFGDGDWLREGAERLRGKFQAALGGVSERLANGTQALDDLIDAKAQLEGMMSPEEMAEYKSRMAGVFAADLVLDKTVGKLRRYVPKGAGEYPAMILNKLANGRQTLSDLGRTQFAQDNEWEGGVRGLAARTLKAIGSSFDKQGPDTTLSTGHDVNALNDPSMSGIDNRTKVTINDILPGYLARMLQQLQIQNGDTSAQLLLYDVRSSKFKKSREIIRDVNKRIMEGYSRDTQRTNANTVLSNFARNTLEQSNRKSIREAENFLMDYSESGGRLDLASIRASDLYRDLSQGATALIDDVMTTVEQDELPQQAQRRLIQRLERIRESGHNSAKDMQEILTEGHGWALEELGYGQYDRNGNFERNNERAMDLARNWHTRVRNTELTAHDRIRASVAKPLSGNERLTSKDRDAQYRRKYAYFRDCDAMTLGVEGVSWGHFKEDRMFLREVEMQGYDKACGMVIQVMRDAWSETMSPEDLKKAEREIRKSNKAKRASTRKTKEDPVGVHEDGTADSDINLKENIKPYDPNQSLTQIRKTRVYDWAYKKDGKKRSGPMAQDVQRHMGNDTAPRGRSVDLISMNGKAMAAIQALDAQMRAKFKLLERGKRSATSSIEDLMAKTFGRRERLASPTVETSTPQTDNQLLTSIDRRLADIVNLSKLSIEMYAGGNVQIKGLFRGMFDGAYERFQVGSKWLKNKLGRGMGWAKQKWEDGEEGRDELRGRVRKGLRRGFRKGMAETKRTLFKRIPSFNRTVQGWLQPYYDLYVKTDLENPILYGNLLQDGQYVDAKSGEVLRYISDIQGPVKDIAGNYVITKRDFAKGIVNARGEPVSFKWQGWTDLADNVRGAVQRRVSKLGQFVLDKLQSVQDVYVKGEIEARLTAAKMEAGVYIDKTSGKIIRSIADIKGEVVDTAGNIVLSAQDFGRGLLDRHGEELRLKFRGVRDIVTTGLKNGIAKGAQAVGFVSDMARLGFDAINRTIGQAREAWGVGASSTQGKTMSDTLLEIRAILQTHLGPADPELMPKINSQGEFVGPPKPGALRAIRQSFKSRFGDMRKTIGGSAYSKASGTEPEGDTGREASGPDQVAKGGFEAGAGILGALGETRDYLSGVDLKGKLGNRYRNSRIGKLLAPGVARIRGMFTKTDPAKTAQQELKARLMAKHGHKLKSKEGEGEQPEVNDTVPETTQPQSKLAQLRERVKGSIDRFRSRGQKEGDAEQSEGEKKPGLMSRISDGIQNFRSRGKSEETLTPQQELKARLMAKHGHKLRDKDYRDQNGDGLREGHFMQRKAEMEARAQANRKSLLPGQTQAKYTEGGVFQQLWGLVKNIGGMVGSVFSGISGLVSGVGSFLGIGGAAGGLMSKLGGFLGMGAKGKGVVDMASGIGQAANATQKAGILGRTLGAIRTVGAPIANVASKAAPALRVIGTVGNVVGAIGGVTGIFGSAVSVGASILSFALASPLIMGTVATAAAGYGLYRAYKYFTRNSTDQWQDIRVKQYGLRNDDTDKQFVSSLLELEGYMLDGRIVIGPQGAELLSNKIDNAEVLKIFGADPEDESLCRAIGVYLQQRFLPFLMNAVNALQAADPRAKLTNLDKLTPEAKLKFLAKLGYESGPYHITVSPFKDLSKLFGDKTLATEAIKKLQTSVEETAAKDKDKKKAADEGRSDAVQMNRDLEAARKAKAEAQAKALAEARRNNTVSGNKPSAAPPLVPPMGSGQGDGQKPSNSGSGAPGNTSVSAPPSASGPVLAGINASQYLKLASGVSLSGMNPTLLKYLNGMAEEYGRATGKPILIKSGYRSYDQQLALFNKYRNEPGRAAKPGNSLHEFGLALDIEPADVAKLEQMGLMRKYGFTRPVGGEDWHVEPAGIQGAITQARNDSNLASSLIAAGLGKGGGGYGTVPGATRFRRDDDLARRLMGLPARKPNETMDPPMDNQRPATQNGVMQAGGTAPTYGRPDPSSTQRPAATRGTGSPIGTMPVYQPAGGQGDGRPPAGWTGGQSGAQPNPTENGQQPKGNNDPSKINRNTSTLEIIRQTAKSIGADPERLATFAAIESGLNPRAMNSKTGARGLFQFLDSTWNDHIRKAAKRYNLGPNPTPEDPVASTIMAHDYMNTYVKSLSSNPTATEMYLVHFLGPAGARKFMSLPNDAIAANALPAQAKQNAEIFYANGRALTKGEVYNLITSRIQARARQFGINAPAATLAPSPSLTTGGKPSSPSVVPTGNSGRYSDYASDAAKPTPSSRTPSQSSPSVPFPAPVSAPMDSAVDATRSSGVSMTRTNSLLQDSLKVETLMLEELKAIKQHLKGLGGSQPAATAVTKPDEKPSTNSTPAPANGMTNVRSKPSEPAAQPGPSRVSLARGTY